MPSLTSLFLGRQIRGEESPASDPARRVRTIWRAFERCRPASQPTSSASCLGLRAREHVRGLVGLVETGGVHSYLTPFIFGPPPEDRPGSRSGASPTNAARIPDCSRAPSALRDQFSTTAGCGSCNGALTLAATDFRSLDQIQYSREPLLSATEQVCINEQQARLRRPSVTLVRQLQEGGR